MKITVRWRSAVEILEARIAPAVHTWTGGGTDNLWSNAANWIGGSPAGDLSGDIDLVFPTNAARLAMNNDLSAMVVDSIRFSVGNGTTASGYTIDGNSVSIDTGGAGQDPFGIDVAAGVADPANGVTQTFNIGILLAANDATFRTAENHSRLTFHGDIGLGGRTLAIDNAGLNDSAVQGVVIDGDISDGNLIKAGGGTLQLSGDNTHADTALNDGVVVATSHAALGALAGTITVNEPGKLVLRNGITVVKELLNLNSNQLGGGLGADGNTANTFRGSVVLMAGAGGVSLGAGVGVDNAGTRLVIDGEISGATSTLSLNGAGVIEFTQNNSYTGVTNFNGINGFGAVQIDSPGGLGVDGAGNETQLNRTGTGPAGSSLWLNFDGTLSESIRFAGGGVNNAGAIRVLGDHQATVSGSVTLIGDAPWSVSADAGSLTLTGVIDDEGSNRALTKVGAGTLWISGLAVNTYSGGTLINAGTLNVLNTEDHPLGDDPVPPVPNAATVNSGGTLRVGSDVTIPNGVRLNPGGRLDGTGTVATVQSNGGMISPGVGAGRLTAGNVFLDAITTVVLDINGPAAGALHDQLRVNGGINLGNARLVLTGGFAATPGTQLTIIENDNADLPTGTFIGLPQGARLAVGGQIFSISYQGGDGNDVVLTAVPALSDLAISANGRAATYTDVDGDLVTIKSTKGTLAAADFTFGFVEDNRQQLQRLVLSGTDAGTNLTVTAKRTAAGGDGFASVGHISAAGVGLGTVLVDGDLGRITAGAVKGLTVQSLGALGLASQAAGGSLVSNLAGNLGKLTVKASVHGATVLGTSGIGPVTILGSFLGGRLSTGADLGVVSVRGDIVGTENAPVIISGFGKTVAPMKGADVAIKGLKVAGGVEFLRVLGGYNLALAGTNADASIGAIAVGADWRASTVLAGVSAGADGLAGTADDAKLKNGARDHDLIFSAIASFTVKGQALGSVSNGDTFGVVAELIAKGKVGKAGFKFDKGARDAVDAFALAATGPGATGLASDLFLREATV